MKKRILSLVLALTMILSLGVSATDDFDFSNATAITSTHTTLASGDYYLESDVILNNSLIVKTSGTVVNLYLNGHVLTGNGQDPVIEVQSSGYVLNIYDVQDGETRTYAIPYDTENTFAVEGGVITGGVGNSGYGGGGIMLYAGTVNMYGGNIVCNSTQDGTLTYGAGVHVDTGGYFNLYGG